MDPHRPATLYLPEAMGRTAWAVAALLIAAAGCGGGPGGTPVAPPTAPTPPPAPEPTPPPDPPIEEITPVGRGISVTAENQILLELMPEDVVSANPLDLAGRTLMFTPAGGGYSREVRALDWEEEADDAEQMRGPAEVELEHFRFPFAGREWDSFFYTRPGLISFGKPIPSDGAWPKRFGTMPQLFDLFAITPTISALYKPHLGGVVKVSNLPDRMIVAFFAWDWLFTVYGRRPQETFDFQIVLHSDGRIALNYGPPPQDPDEAFGDGIVGVFTIPEGADDLAPIDLSRPDPRPSTVQYEVFRYPMIRDGRDGVAHVSCRIIEVLGDEFDFLAFNSQFRVDQQETGPAHGGHGGYYWTNIRAEVEGIGIREEHRTTPCQSRLKNSWGFPVWMKARTVVHESHAELPGQTPYDWAMTYFAHEIGHTWLAYADYLKNGERRSLKDTSGHWIFGLHTPAPFPRWGIENGSVMVGAYWRENSDGTFTPTSGWSTQGGGFSWLDLYLMGLATPDEVPDMFVLHNLEQVGEERDGPYTGEKEIVSMEQVLAAMGPRNPLSERARKVFNTGFVYFLLPGQEPDPELLREHARYRDRAVEHWRHVTGGRGQLTTELPGR